MCWKLWSLLLCTLPLACSEETFAFEDHGIPKLATLDGVVDTKVLEELEVMYLRESANASQIQAYISLEQAEQLKAREVLVHWELDEAREYHRRLLQQTAHSGNPLGAYHTNEELEAFVKEFATTGPCASRSRAYSIGKSVEGREMWVLEISDKPGVDEPEPNFKYVANMHGNEPLGRQLLIRLAGWLCEEYLKPDGDTDAREIVDHMHLHLLFSMNPDGFHKHSRGNAHGKDLNRDFPDQYTPSGIFKENWSQRQPETANLMRWSMATHFVASASFHEGALVANYPWDGSSDRRTHYAECPDDGAYRQLALAYSQVHPVMRNSQQFKQGITNGAQWYPLYGGMQDWNYLVGKCLDITVEMNDRKWPDASQLSRLFDEHLRSLLQLPLAAAYGGIRGFIRNGKGLPLGGSVVVQGAQHPSSLSSELSVPSSDTSGIYFRPLPPGKYNVTASAAGYHSESSMVEVPVSKAFTPEAGLVLDFTLRSQSETVDEEAAEKELADLPQESPGEVEVLKVEAELREATSEHLTSGTVYKGSWSADATATQQLPRSLRGGQSTERPILGVSLWVYGGVLVSCFAVASCVQRWRKSKGTSMRRAGHRGLRSQPL